MMRLSTQHVRRGVSLSSVVRKRCISSYPMPRHLPTHVRRGVGGSSVVRKRCFSSDPGPRRAVTDYLLYAGFVLGSYAALVHFELLPSPIAEKPSREVAKVAEDSVTDHCFLKVQIGDNEEKENESTEVIVLALYGNDAPKTVLNFKTLCESKRYRGMRFHRIIPDFVAQSGDYTRGDGTGGRSIFNGPFPDEPFIHKHTGAGILSMANRGPGTNTSQFFITFRSCPHLDGRHVVFGQVVQGMETLRAIEKVGTRSAGKPTKPVTVLDCGLGFSPEDHPVKEESRWGGGGCAA